MQCVGSSEGWKWMISFCWINMVYIVKIFRIKTACFLIQSNSKCPSQSDWWGNLCITFGPGTPFPSGPISPCTPGKPGSPWDYTNMLIYYDVISFSNKFVFLPEFLRYPFISWFVCLQDNSKSYRILLTFSGEMVNGLWKKVIIIWWCYEFLSGSRTSQNDF